MTPAEITFEIREDDVDGGYNACAPDFHIFTQGDTLAELQLMVKDAVACHFGGDPTALPSVRYKPMPHGEHPAGGQKRGY